MLTEKTRASLAVIVGAYALWFLLHFNDSVTADIPKDMFTANEMAGTWTDPKGPAGNQISFVWTKIKDEPGDPIALVVSAYNCSGEIKDLFGFKDLPFTFGFRSYAPSVVIFANHEHNQTVMQLKALDHQHLRLQILSRDLDKQKEELGQPPAEAAVNLVREKEPGYKPNYK